MTRWEDLTAEEREELCTRKNVPRNSAYFRAWYAVERRYPGRVGHNDLLAACFMAGYEAVRRPTAPTPPGETPS